MFSVEFFSKIALGYSIAGIALWLSDFGSNNWMLIQYGRKEFEKLQIEWSFRYLRVLFFGSIISASIFFLNKDSILAVITFVCLLDLDADTSLGIRQLIYTPRKAVLLHSLKKILQLLLFLSWFLYGSSDNQLTFALVLIFPVVLIKVVDTHAIGGLRFNRKHARKDNSFPMWLQGGYTSLVNLDLVILAYFQEYELIATLAIGKKLYSALYIFASTLSTEILGSSEKDLKINDNSSRVNAFRQTMFLSIVASIFIILFLKPILALLSPNERESLNTVVILTMVAVTPFGIPGSFYNAILLRRKRFLLSAVQGFVSAILYLLCIFWIGLLSNFAIAIIIGLFLKILSEFVLGRLSIANKNSAES